MRYFLWLKKTSLTIALRIGLSLLLLCSTVLCLAQENPKNTPQLFDHRHQTPIIYLAVAANFKSTLHKLVDSFLLQHPDINKKQLSIISGSTGALYAQITQGAPFDIFFAADTLRPKQLLINNHSANQQYHTYAYGQLALVFKAIQGKSVCKKNIDTLFELNQLIAQLPPSRQATLAIANPTTAPYGASANALISRLDKSFSRYRLVKGKNILHAQQLLLNGNANLAILSTTQAKHPIMADYQFCTINKAFYTPIEQAMVSLKDTTSNDDKAYLTNAFFNFIKTQQAKKIITLSGYLTD